MDEGDEGGKAQKELNLVDAVPLSRLRAEKTKQMTVELSADTLTDERMDQLKAALEKHPGPVTTVLRLKVPMRSTTDCVLPARFNVSPTDELLVRIEKLFGADAARLR
jgi:DNA polymerase-3 subunit alpha